MLSQKPFFLYTRLPKVLTPRHLSHSRRVPSTDDLPRNVLPIFKSPSILPSTLLCREVVSLSSFIGSLQSSDQPDSLPSMNHPSIHHLPGPIHFWSELSSILFQNFPEQRVKLLKWTGYYLPMDCFPSYGGLYVDYSDWDRCLTHYDPCPSN